MWNTTDTVANSRKNYTTISPKKQILKLHTLNATDIVTVSSQVSVTLFLKQKVLNYTIIHGILQNIITSFGQDNVALFKK